MSFYAVAKGLVPGIYNDWLEAKAQVNGFPNAVFKLFKTLKEAEAFMALHTKAEAEVEAVEEEKKEAKISKLDTLTHEQRAVFDYLLEGQSMALLGPAGVGKSYLLSIIYTELPEKRPCMIQLCAMTGCAALLIGHKAKTLHSWAGIGLGKDDVDTLYMKICKNGRAKKNWRNTDVLVIDEISMATPDLLDKLNALGKKLRRSAKPFGGIQILFVGDFYQLPPVNKVNHESMFAFECDAWKETVTRVMELTIIQRQKDPVFQRVLMEARAGSFSAESCAILEGCKREWRQNKIRPTLIFPRRMEVDQINTANLTALQGEVHIYKAKITLTKPPIDFKEKSEAFQSAVAALDNDASYFVELELRVGAQVMLCANIDSDMGLVNGSRGVIVRICPASHMPYVEFVNGVERMIGPHEWVIDGYPFASRSQVPLRLSYAITIHRSQGSTLDCALVDVGVGTFEYGQAYVALSRVTSLEALYIHSFDPGAFRVHPKVREFYKALKAL